MKKIGFIGAYDKTNLLIYISKLLTESKLKVLIIDATILQKTRYTVPCIKPYKRYITTYEDIDIAIGFESINEIETYIRKKINNYDIVFIDIDNIKRFTNFEMQNNEKNYFVTSFETYSLKRGLKVVGKSGYKNKITKILFSKNMDKLEDEYLNYLSSPYNINWDKEKIYFPFENGDDSVIIENQRNGRISYRDLSLQYKNGIFEIICQIAPELEYGDIKRMLKNI